MDTSNVSRVEIIDHTEKGEGRAYTFWDHKNKSDVQLSLQDEGRTLKVFIRNK